jgi:hypothetical protein
MNYTHDGIESEYLRLIATIYYSNFESTTLICISYLCHIRIYIRKAPIYFPLMYTCTCTATSFLSQFLLLLQRVTVTANTWNFKNAKGFYLHDYSDRLTDN